MKDMEHLVGAFKEHIADDAKRFDALQDTLNDIQTDLKEIKENIKPLTEAYNGVVFGKKVLMGTAGIVMALASIGGGILWLMNALKK